jgi:hypothetical protein
MKEKWTREGQKLQRERKMGRKWIRNPNSELGDICRSAELSADRSEIGAWGTGHDRRQKVCCPQPLRIWYLDMQTA